MDLDSGLVTAHPRAHLARGARAPGGVLVGVSLEFGVRQAEMPRVRGECPKLLDRVQPLTEVIAVERGLPGYPPPAARIRRVLEALVRGEIPQLEGPDGLRFG